MAEQGGGESSNQGAPGSAPLRPLPMLTPHLQAGERVLWQQPTDPAARLHRQRQKRQLAGAAIAIGVALWILLLYLSWNILAEDFAVDPIHALVGVATLWLLLGVLPVPAGLYFWRQAESIDDPGICALTDRRMLQVAGTQLRVSEPWNFVREVESFRTGPGFGSVNWRIVREVQRARPGEPTPAPTVTRIGFEDLADPDAVAEILRRWHDERREASGAMLQRFATAAAEGRLAEAERAGDAWTLTAPDQGFAVTVPGDWQAVVDRFRYVGPVPVGSGWRSWVAGVAEWNALLMLAPAEAGLRLVVHEGPLDRRFEDVRDNLWEGLTGGSVVAADPVLRIGPWRGFAVARGVRGSGFAYIGLGDVDVMRRDVWIDAGARHFHVSLVATAKNSVGQRALNAVVASLRPG